jgi:hypothetical protein
VVGREDEDGFVVKVMKKEVCREVWKSLERGE